VFIGSQLERSIGRIIAPYGHDGKNFTIGCSRLSEPGADNVSTDPCKATLAGRTRLECMAAGERATCTRSCVCIEALNDPYSRVHRIGNLSKADESTALAEMDARWSIYKEKV